MKSRIFKGILTFTLCIAMIFGNVGYAFAEGESVSGNTSNEPVVELTSEEPSTGDNIIPEGSLASDEGVDNDEAGENGDVEEPSSEAASTEEATTIADEEVPGSAMPTDSVSDNSVSENSVSENSVSGNSINLPLSEDGKFYILSKNIEGRDITITLNIPVDLFPEATEITFDAVEAEEEVQDEFENAVADKVNEESVVTEALLFDITLFVDGEQVTTFDDTIKVAFAGENIPTEVDENDEVEVYHFDEDKEILSAIPTAIETNEDGKQEVVAEVEHFSLYGVTRKTPRDYNSRTGILNAMGDSRYFSVFTRNFYNYSHTEGNVAVEIYQGGNSGINVFGSNNRAVNAALEFEIQIEKKVSAVSASDRTFYFSVYETKDHSTGAIANATVMVAAGQLRGISTITKNDGSRFDSTKVYYIYETNGVNGQVLEDGTTFQDHGIRYEVDYSKNELSGVYNKNCIEQINCKSASKLFNENNDGIMINEIIFGNGSWLDDKTIKQGYSWRPNYKKVSDNLTKTNISIANGNVYVDGVESEETYGDFPIDFDDEFDELEQLSGALVNSTGTDLRIQPYTAQYIMNNPDTVRGDIDSLLANNKDKLVIINVDCSDYNNKKSSISLQLNMSEKFTQGQKSDYNNLMWNFYTRDKKTSTTYAYTRTININGVLGGTILAPNATVYTTSNVEGTIIAEELTIKGEVHEVYISDTPDHNIVGIECTNIQKGTVPVEKPLEVIQSKEAKLKDWDARTYDINLKVNTEKQQAVGNDVVIVLDCSGSMNAGTRMSDLQLAAKEFVTSLTENDRVAIIEYNNDAVIKQSGSDIFYQAKINDSINPFVDEFIDSLDNEMGTRTDLALSKAIDVLSSDTSSINTKSVVLFTDGSPTNASNTHILVKTIVESAMDNSTTIKNAGISLHTIAYNLADGFSGNNSDPKWGIDAYKGTVYSGAKEWLEHAIATEGCYYEATDLNTLKNAFSSIGSSLSKKITIKDYIDNRFDLVVGNDVYTSKKELEDLNYSLYKNGSKKSAVPVEILNGKLSVAENGQLLLTWNETVETIQKTSEQPDGWTKTIVVKAKEDYIGGNAVLTNGVDSGVTIEDKDGNIPFDKPEVNVKVRFDVDEAETTMFWGEQLKDNTETVTKGSATGIETFDYLADSIYEELLYKGDNNCVTWTDESGATIPLYYYDDGVKSSEPVKYSKDAFDTKWFEKCDGTICDQEIEDMDSVSENGIYYCQFSFKNTGISSEKSKKSCTVLTDGNEKLYEVTPDNSQAVGKYTVKIIAGTLTITKEIQGDYKKINGDPIFTFKIEDVSNANDKIDGFTNKTYYKTLRFMDGAGGTLQAIITGLPKGEYVITELDTMGFNEESHAIVDTDCYNDEENAIYLGYRRNGEGIYKNNALHTYAAEKGGMKYINTCNHTKKITHTDTVKNTYVVNPDGTTFWTSAQEDVDNGETQELPYPRKGAENPFNIVMMQAPDIMSNKENVIDMESNEIQE